MTEHDDLRSRVRDAQKTVRDMNENEVARGRRRPKTRREWEIRAGVREPPDPVTAPPDIPVHAMTKEQLADHLHLSHSRDLYVPKRATKPALMQAHEHYHASGTYTGSEHQHPGMIAPRDAPTPATEVERVRWRIDHPDLDPPPRHAP